MKAAAKITDHGSGRIFVEFDAEQIKDALIKAALIAAGHDPAEQNRFHARAYVEFNLGAYEPSASIFLWGPR